MDKFYKTVFTVEVLSDKPVENLELDDIAYEITNGDCSGKVTSEAIEVTRQEMAQLLEAQGSDPEFLLGEEPASGEFED